MRRDSVAWGEAAACVFDAWPRVQLIAALGSDSAHIIPSAYHPAPVQWEIPIFIVRALQHQAAAMRENDPRVNAEAAVARLTSSSLDDYIADVLFNEIQPATVVELSHDPAFAQAYHYPFID